MFFTKIIKRNVILSLIMSKDIIIITGASGLLGSALLYQLAPFYRCIGICHTHNITTPNAIIVNSDFRKKENIYKIVNEYAPDILIHCAAMTNVDLCEQDKDACFETNVTMTQMIVDAVNNSSKKTKIIYISTDFVYDGSKGAYTEKDDTCPVNYYGKTKYMGEKIIQTNDLPYIILRTSIYGSNIQPKWSFYEYVFHTLKQGNPVSLPEDCTTSMISTWDFAEKLYEILKKQWRDGIFNLCCCDYMSRYEFGKTIAQMNGYDEKLVRPIQDGQNIRIVPRPKKIHLNTEKIQKIFNISLPTMKESLKHTKEQEHNFLNAGMVCSTKI